MGERSTEAAVTEALRRDLDLGPRLERFPDGSVPVFAAGERVVKLFPPGDRAAFETERARDLERQRERDLREVDRAIEAAKEASR